MRKNYTASASTLQGSEIGEAQMRATVKFTITCAKHDLTTDPKTSKITRNSF